MKKATAKTANNARKKKTLGNAVVKPKSGAPVNLKVAVDVTEDTPIYYANYFEVGHSNFEFMLNVARFPPKPSMEQMRVVTESGALVVTPEMQVLFAPKVALALLDALKQQIASYEENIGKIEP
jgi:hypothetical protein